MGLNPKDFSLSLANPRSKIKKEKLNLHPSLFRVCLRFRVRVYEFFFGVFCLAVNSMDSRQTGLLGLCFVFFVSERLHGSNLAICVQIISL